MKRDDIIFLSSLGYDSKLIEKFYRTKRDFDLLKKESIEDLDFLSNKDINLIDRENYLRRLEKFNEFLRVNKIKVVTYLDETYPEKYKNIEAPPMILYYKGLWRRDEFSLAMVGSRKASSYGSWACRKIAKRLSEVKIPLVSGLALGIDRLVHEECIKNGNKTIAILGNGIDIIYPSSNKDLYKKIEDTGLIISEFPIGTPAFSYNFLRRNRLISAYSDGLIVVEAAKKSGSMNTVNHAANQGKEVFVVPGNINSSLSYGTNEMIFKGAIPIYDIDLFIKNFTNIDLLDKLSVKLTKEEEEIYNLICEYPKTINEIIGKSVYNISQVLTILTSLEINGLIVRDKDKFSRGW